MKTKKKQSQGRRKAAPRKGKAHPPVSGPGNTPAGGTQPNPAGNRDNYPEEQTGG